MSSPASGGEKGTEFESGDDARPRAYGERLLRVLRARSWTIVLVLGLSLVLNVCGLAAPRFTQEILDRLQEHSDTSFVPRLVLALGLITAVQLLATVWRRLRMVRLSLDLDLLLLGELYAHVFSLPSAFFRATRIGELVARFHDHVYVRLLFVGTALRSGADTMMIALYVGVMFTYSAPLALWVLGALACLAAFTLCLGPLMKRRHQESLESRTAQDSQLVEALMGIDLSNPALEVKRGPVYW